LFGLVFSGFELAGAMFAVAWAQGGSESWTIWSVGLLFGATVLTERLSVRLPRGGDVAVSDPAYARAASVADLAESVLEAQDSPMIESSAVSMIRGRPGAGVEVDADPGAGVRGRVQPHVTSSEAGRNRCSSALWRVAAHRRARRPLGTSSARRRHRSSCHT
jgi:hypothetical protein